VAAEVIRAALHVTNAQVAQERFEKGNIAKEELVLQRFGSGGDNHALSGAERGQQIGEGFAGACSCFDDQMAMLGQRAFDGLCHFKLAAAVLVRQRRARKNAARRKELVERGQGAG